MSAPTYSHGLPGILVMLAGNQGMGQFLIVSSISVFMLIQYRDSHSSSLVISMAMWLWCSSSSALSCSAAGTTIPWSFIAFYLWLKSHVWMTSMAAVPSVPQCLLMANHGVWVLTACLGTHDLVFLFLFFCCYAVWYVCAWLLCLWWSTCLVFFISVGFMVVSG